MSAPTYDHRDVLVIKLGAFGDFITALGPFQAIRRAHPRARITLLTTPPFTALAQQSGLFDRVEDDGRPKSPIAWARLVHRLRSRRFARVYDLQRNDRSAMLFRLLSLARPDMEWSGVVKGARLWVADEREPRRHAFVKLAEQLAVAGISACPTADLGFLDGDLSAFSLTGRFALLVPGGAPSRPRKRAPAATYAAVARGLDLPCVLIGTGAEAEVLEDIAAAVPGAINLCGRTDFGQIAALARRAELAVGNDTGPMHLIGAAGCRSLVLFSDESDPVECRPWGPRVGTLQCSDLAALPAETVLSKIREG